MTTLVYFLLIATSFASISHGYKISQNCVDECKSTTSRKCSEPCDIIDSSLLSSLKSTYGHGAIDVCLAPCRCDKFEYAYSSDKFCEYVLSLTTNCKCKKGIVPVANLGGIDNRVGQDSAEVKAETSTSNPWETWCKHMCAEGMGGSACYCDIIP